MDEESDADDRRVVRYLRDKTAPKLRRELAGLDEDDAVGALRHAEDLLGNALTLVRLRLNAIVATDDGE